jgi:septal ring factor EnvC (AmiA/AmiB activator)
MAPPKAAAPAGGVGNPNPFGTKSLEFTGGSDPNAKTVRLRDALNEADTERRKAQEEAEARERAAEIRREERLKKIAYMRDMPDSQPAGTGKSKCFEHWPM